ncbi:MAG: sulfatase-like hydrolase/transferase [Planctomycetota bacterium]
MNLKSLLPLLVLALLAAPIPLAADENARPNILWLTSEDNGPELGCYGDKYATTPNLNALAARGMIYLNAWSTAPVCAPARTTLISGVYPTSTGAEHMRSGARLPEGFKMYPQYLREAGYYCTNNSKEDYNLEKPGQVWDDSSRNGHYKNRKPGQPFFAIFNFTVSHESKIRTRPHTLVHDPKKVRVPKYHPDTPEVRHDWAQYYDNLTTMDGLVGKALKELEDAGLADDTIIFYYGDHGSGMPRSKRWPYNSGLNVPLIVHIPEKFQHLAPKSYSPGGQTNRLVGFIDFPATLLSLAGVQPPDHFQGHAFMGQHEAPAQPYIFGFRGRMDERYDMVRTVRDQRYHYIRNYNPHKIYGQYIAYMFVTPTTRVWKEMYDAGKLNEAQAKFWQTKPAEELYDLRRDPDEVKNLAHSPDHQEILAKLRQALQGHMIKTRDIGFLPEPEIRARTVDSTAYEVGHAEGFPIRNLIKAANIASSGDPSNTPLLAQALGNHKFDPAIRYWAALGLRIRGEDAVRQSLPSLRAALKDPNPSVRIAAAEALGLYGEKDDLKNVLPTLLELSNIHHQHPNTAMLALNVIDYLDSKADPILKAVKALPQELIDNNQYGGRTKNYLGYVKNLINKIEADAQ